MTLRLDDRWLWVGLGIFFYIGTKGIQYAMHDMNRLTELDPPERKPNKRPEDALRLDTLSILAKHPNPKIAQTAIALIVDRFTRNRELMNAVRNDRDESTDETIRYQAFRIDEFLQEWRKESTESSLSFPPSEMADTPVDMGLNDRSEMLDSSSSLVSRLEELEAEMINAGDAGMFNRRPPATNDLEEAARRRNRREAMVLHEGSGRINESDIYRRAM